MTNILILAAGAGKRFSEAGYDTPKPAIKINDTPMIIHAAKSLKSTGKMIFVVQKSHNLKSDIIEHFPDSVILELSFVANGAAASAMLAMEHIDSTDDLIILNCDQVIEYDVELFNRAASDADGVLGVYPVDGDRWSFAEISDGVITKVAEKQRISDYGLVGLHYWRHGSDFVKYVKEMIKDGNMVNGEYYIAPTYQYAINDGKKILPIIVDKFLEVGTPTSLQQNKGMIE